MDKKKMLDIFLKLKSDRKMMILICGIIIGIILFVISAFQTENVNDTEVTVSDNVSFDEKEYTELLENKLEEMISLINGAGQTRVIVTLECDYETVYAKDGSLTQNDKTTDEQSEYIIIDTEKSEGGLLLKTVTPKIRGVAVVCSGGDSQYVKAAITEMLTAVLDIGANHVSVSKIR